MDSISVRLLLAPHDLLSDDAWRDKEALIARLGLPVLSQPIMAQLAELEERLRAVNQRIATGDNTHVRITQRGSTVRWTLASPRATPTVNHALFDALLPRDIGSIVHFVDRRCPFLHHFDHLLPRFAKRRADARVLRACLVAWGINMGLGRMGETSLPTRTARTRSTLCCCMASCTSSRRATPIFRRRSAPPSMASNSRASMRA